MGEWWRKLAHFVHFPDAYFGQGVVVVADAVVGVADAEVEEFETGCLKTESSVYESLRNLGMLTMRCVFFVAAGLSPLSLFSAIVLADLRSLWFSSLAYPD